MSSLVGQAHNPRIWKLKQGDGEFPTSLDYKVRLISKPQSMGLSDMARWAVDPLPSPMT